MSNREAWEAAGDDWLLRREDWQMTLYGRRFAKWVSEKNQDDAERNDDKIQDQPTQEREDV